MTKQLAPYEKEMIRRLRVTRNVLESYNREDLASYLDTVAGYIAKHGLKIDV